MQSLQLIVHKRTPHNATAGERVLKTFDQVGIVAIRPIINKRIGKHRPLTVDLALAIGYNLLAFKVVEQLYAKLAVGELAVLRHGADPFQVNDLMFTIVSCNRQIRQNCTCLGS